MQPCVKPEVTRYFAKHAWVNGAWAHDVVLSVGQDGLWAGVETDVPPAFREYTGQLKGAVLPSLVNGNSHAFQRAIAGLTECRNVSGTLGADDDFWSWRERMYSAANRITPEQLEAIATLLYAELLMGGYTDVCEFHYLHSDLDAKPYASPMEMLLALVRAAKTTGIGLTLLPTLYMRSGFGAVGLKAEQRRFAGTPDRVLRIVEGISSVGNTIHAGVAVHSLRAADMVAIQEVDRAAQHSQLAVHIHIAEQTQEVNDCLAHHGQRPIDYLLSEAQVNSQWNLVHATYTTATELEGVARSGAAIVIRPSTEANLGDGVFDYTGFGRLQGRWSIGSDSHATRSWPEEMRLLEYSQRLSHRKRNIAARVAQTSSTAAALFEVALAGGNAATALPLGDIAVGNRADFLVLDQAATALVGVPEAQILDALVFSTPHAPFAHVFVAGQPVASAGKAWGSQQAESRWSGWVENFRQTMHQLWR